MDILGNVQLQSETTIDAGGGGEVKRREDQSSAEREVFDCLRSIFDFSDQYHHKFDILRSISLQMKSMETLLGLKM